MVLTVADVDTLHDDARACAERAGLVYVDGEPPGISRRRYGRGFGYSDATGTALSAQEKRRIEALAIPPAWRAVWICADADGHLLATGQDERGRKQYLYHPRWREARDLVNFYRLIAVSRSLPRVRRHVAAQLRRRTLDRDRVVGGMLGLLDRHLVRIGSESYAEENGSYGLSTLRRDHLALQGPRARLCFPAKSGRRAELVVTEPAIVRLLTELAARAPRQRLFTVDGQAIDAEAINAALRTLGQQDITAKDYRTWGGTTVAFSQLRRHAGPAGDQVILAAIDAAADALGNTRAVAREHYVHPHVIEAARAGTLRDYLARAPKRRRRGLSGDESALAAVLRLLFEDTMASSAELG